MKKKLNIWMINQFASTPRMPGKQRDYQYAKAFASEGHHVTLWRSSFSHWSREELITDKKPYITEKDGSLEIYHLKTRPPYYKNDHRRFLNMISFAHAFWKISSTVSVPPDVIIAAYPSPFAAFAACRVSSRYNAKFILEIGDLWPQVWIERKAFSRFHPFILILSVIEKYLHRNTKIFVSSLPYVNDYLHEKGVGNHKFSWIPNGINPDDFNFNGSSINSENLNDILSSMDEAKKNGHINAVYIGGIGVGNRVDCIVQAAKILKDNKENKICFHVIGDGHSKDSIVRYVADNKLGTVRIWNPVIRKAVPRILSHADVGILCLHNNPIYRYGVNLSKLYDYMASRLPVVFSADVRNNLVEQYQSGITVPPSDPGGIAAALQKFLSMTDKERKSIGKRGSKGIVDDYDINKLSKRYLEVIRG